MATLNDVAMICANLKPIRSTDIREQKNCITITKTLRTMQTHPEFDNHVKRLHTHATSFADVVAESKQHTNTLIICMIIITILSAALLIMIYKSIIIGIMDGTEIAILTNYPIVAGILLICILMVTNTVLTICKKYNHDVLAFTL
jgi:hypothetical protein